MKFFNFWKKDQHDTTEKNKNDTYIDIIISLNKNRQIDFSIFLDDKMEKISMGPIDYAVMCGEFFHTVLSRKMKEDSIEILDGQIKNNNNHELINNIVSVISLMDNPKDKSVNSNQFIKPSEVFARYIA